MTASRRPSCRASPDVAGGGHHLPRQQARGGHHLPRPHVLAEAAQAAELALDPGNGHECAAPAPARQQPLAAQAVERLPCGHPRDAELLCQLRLRGDRLARPPGAREDPSTDMLLHLGVARLRLLPRCRAIHRDLPRRHPAVAPCRDLSRHSIARWSRQRAARHGRSGGSPGGIDRHRAVLLHLPYAEMSRLLGGALCWFGSARAACRRRMSTPAP